MRLHSPAFRRSFLTIEELEQRLVLATGQTVHVPLDPILDQFGDQIVTVQAYADKSRTAFGIYDTGAGALTFSATDQANFTAQGNPIPIKVPNGARADGIGGAIVGDVSQPPPPGTGIIATGLHGATMSFNGTSPAFNVDFGQGAAVTPGIQAFVGTKTGSPMLPTITGMPIMNGGTSQHPGPYAALVNMQGATLDFSSVVSGLHVTLPDLSFVDAGTKLPSDPGMTGPLTIPLSFYGNDNHTNPGLSVTESPSPVQTNVGLAVGTARLQGQTFLLDTGAQMTVLSAATAQALGLNLAHPERYLSIEGVGGSTYAPGFTLNDLDLPLTTGGELDFTNVPVFVLNVADGLDGLLGMNLWNSASKLLYDPYGPGGPTLSVNIHSTPQPPHGTDGNDLTE
jgi:hypothetical protein